MDMSGQEGRTMTMKLVNNLVEWALFALMFSALFVFKWSVILVIGVVTAALTLT